jgi:hypothetical protein
MKYFSIGSAPFTGFPLYAGRRAACASLAMSYHSLTKGVVSQSVISLMNTKLIAIEKRSGPFRAIFQRVMRMVPDRDKEDKRLQRMLAFRLINDGEAETTAYLIRNIRHFIRRPDPLSFYDFLRNGKDKDFPPIHPPNGGPPGAA